MLEGINIISTEVTKDVTVPMFILCCAIACVLTFGSIQLLKAGFEITKSTPNKLFKIVFNSLNIIILGVCLFFSSVFFSLFSFQILRE